MLNYYNKIQGWCDFHNLYQDLLLNKLPDNATFVEVGSWKGHSICFMAELAKEYNKNIKLFSVDIFAKELDNHLKPYQVEKGKLNGYTEFLLNMARAKVLDRVIPLCLFSDDASKLFYDNSVDCVFLDGAHDEQSVINDLSHWIPKIKQNGYLCGHDYKDGIQPIIDKYFKEKINDSVIEYPPHCFIWQKK